MSLQPKLVNGFGWGPFSVGGVIMEGGQAILVWMDRVERAQGCAPRLICRAIGSANACLLAVPDPTPE